MENKLGLLYADLITGTAEGVLTKDGIELTWKIHQDSPFKDVATVEVVARWKDSKGKEKRISFIGVKSSQVITDEPLAVD
jgi:hypothetical protein